MACKPHILWLIGISLVIINPLYAETRVDGDELVKLISGKTLEGKWIMWDSNYRSYMDPSGELRRVYGKGDKLTNDLSGRWWVNKKGKLCFELHHRSCRRVKKRDDGGYNLYNMKKELKQTIEKIIDGNPYNL